MVSMWTSILRGQKTLSIVLPITIVGQHSHGQHVDQHIEGSEDTLYYRISSWLIGICAKPRPRDMFSVKTRGEAEWFAENMSQGRCVAQSPISTDEILLCHEKIGICSQNRSHFTIPHIVYVTTSILNVSCCHGFLWLDIIFAWRHRMENKIFHDVSCDDDCSTVVWRQDWF